MYADGTRTMIVRGSISKKRPYGKVNHGDRIFFIRNNAPWTVKAMATVKSVFDSEKMTVEESAAFISENKDRLQLTDGEAMDMSGKRYVTVIEIENAHSIVPFTISGNVHGSAGDWIILDDIDEVIN